MAAVSEQTRVNFNPEWMGSTYSASGKIGQGGGPLATSPPFSGGNAGVNSNSYCGGGSAANNADSTILAPPKLAKNRYGREEMLALFNGTATVAPPELKPTFPEFFVEHHQEPICMLPFTDIEERLLMQGGINSSKAINQVNHAERHMRWSQGSPRGFGRGIFMDTAPGGNPDIGPGPQQPAPPFVASRPPGMMGIGRGVARYPAQPGFDPMNRPPGRFGMMGKGRGDGGRGRGFDRFPSGGFGGPPPFNQGGVRFAGNAGGGAQQDEEEWATPQNPRAQGLYDPNDPRDRPRQRQKSTSRADDDDPNVLPYGQPGQVRGPNTGMQRRSYTGQGVPEWAIDDEEAMDDNVGTFDSSGQFQEASESSTSAALDGNKENAVTNKKEQKSAQYNEAVVAPSAAPAMKAGEQKASTKSTSDQSLAEASRKQINRSIPVSSLFNSQPTNSGTPIGSDSPQQTLQGPLGATGNQQNQNRRMPKAFAGLGQHDQAKLNPDGSVSAHSAGASPDASLANLDIGKVMGQQQQSRQAAPFAVPARAEPAVQRPPEPVQVQPKFVVPKAISSSSDEVFNQLHEDVESLVNSFSADDMPTVVRSRTHDSSSDSARRFQQHPVQPDASGNLQQSGRTANAAPQLDRLDSVNQQVKWFYTDPQGGERGPFESAQMATWFTAGYFPMQLLVRKAEDKDFVPLVDLIKQYGRIPFVLSTSSSSANTPSPNPVSTATIATALASDYGSGQVVQPSARYGVSASGTAAQNAPSTVFGAMTNHTGGGAFQKTTSAQATTTMPSNANRGGGGLWDMDFSSPSSAGSDPMRQNKVGPVVSEEDQARLIALNQMLQKEREEEMKRRAEEEERRKLAEIEAARREEEQKRLALIKQREEELRRIQEAKAEAERRRKVAEEEEARRLEEVKRLEEKRMLEEQQRRLEELAKKDAEERRKRAAAEEQLRKEREAIERKRREEEERKAAAAAFKQQQEEQLRKQQKKSATPWGSSQQPQIPQAREVTTSSKQPSKSLMEIQMEEERQMLAERRQEAEVEAQRRQDSAASNIRFGSAWGGASASAKLTWEQTSAKQPGGKSASIWGGKGEVQTVESCGLWDDDSPPSTPPKSAKSQKKLPGKNAKNSKTSSGRSQSPPATVTKKDQNVKKIFHGQQRATDEFTNWCVMQVNALNPNIDAYTLVSFLKEVDAANEVEDYVVSYFGDGRAARDFTKSFLEKRTAMRKSASSKMHADDLSTPAPALNPVKASVVENAAPNAADKASGLAGGGKKKKSGKSAGRFVVDGSILGFKAAADPNRLNAGEIDNPM